MSDEIYPLAYKLSPGQTCKLYYLGFPPAWKAALLNIAKKSNPRFSDEYGLPTNALKKLVDSWMEGVISLAPLKKDSNDEHWLTSCYGYSDKNIDELCTIIKCWIKATYVSVRSASALTKKLIDDLSEEIKPECLTPLQNTATVDLTLKDGTVCEEAYRAIPLLTVNKLLGKEIILCKQNLHLCYSAKNQLISHPIVDTGSKHQYSFVFDLSVQTTPPQREALLLCHMSIRRWIPDCCSKTRAPFLSESIISHVKISEDKYCKVPIAYDHDEKQINWNSQDMVCYSFLGYEGLPPAEDVLKNPGDYKGKILLPYKNGMGGFTASKIGTGVSAVDKASLYTSISDLLCDIVCPPPAAKRITKRNQNFTCFNSPQEYESREDFRRWASKCAETDRLTFEIYGLWKDPDQKKLLEAIESKLLLDFGDESQASCMKIQYLCKEVGTLADRMGDDNKNTKIQRCDEIVKLLGVAKSVTACILVLPGQDYYTSGDPKQVLRNAFARTGRVIQFISPETDVIPNKIDNAVYDLYRQLGIVTLLNFQKNLPPLADTPCVGMHLCTQVHGISNKARFLPLYITVDLKKGITRVHCDAFDKRTVSYREACLEMAKLYWMTDLEKRCVDASYSPAKQKLMELKNLYCNAEEPVLVTVQSDGNTRAVWGGISDKEISGYNMLGKYCPEQMNVGSRKSPYPLPLAGSGVRLVRIRYNQEVPDYYTEHSKENTAGKEQYTEASGVFKYEDVFWSINRRLNNEPVYFNSFRASRIDHPEDRFAERDMIELYPLQLQPDDKADDWIFFTHALRHISIQYSQSTDLPLPLHLAEDLEEYLFNI